MRLWAQWATATPADALDYSSADWHRTPNRGPPRGGDSPDADFGWLHALNVQGLIVSGDAVAVEDLGAGVRVYAETWGGGAPYGRLVEVLELGPDASLNGAINTRMTGYLFSEDPALKALGARPWNHRPNVDPSLWRYGIGMTNPHRAAHEAARSSRQWREWGDHLDPSELRGGRVKPQRTRGRYVPPSGSKTFYASSAVEAGHSHGAAQELLAGRVPDPLDVNAAKRTAAISTAGAELFQFTTAAGEPGELVWADGIYRVQLDALSAHVDAVFGALTLGSGTGHFARVSDSLVQERSAHEQDESAFSLPGIHLATADVTWPSPFPAADVQDRFEALIAGQRIAGSGDVLLELGLNEVDQFLDGPWTDWPPGDTLSVGRSF